MSCFNNKIHRELERFYGQSVTIPLDSLFYSMPENNSEYLNKGNSDHYKIVVYYDSTECSSCRLKNLYKWNHIIDSTSLLKQKVDFYFVLNVSPKRFDYAKRIVSTYAKGLPVYIDSTSVFERKNPCLPTLSQMRTFMLDSNDVVMLVGNPVNNSRVLDMMWNIIRERKEEL